MTDQFFANRMAIECVGGAAHARTGAAVGRCPVVAHQDAGENPGVYGWVVALGLFQHPHFSHCGYTPWLASPGSKFRSVIQGFLARQFDDLANTLVIGKALPCAAAVPAQGLVHIQGAALQVQHHGHGHVQVQHTAALGQA